MKDIIFKGCGTAIATPFANDEIDYLSFQLKHVKEKFQLLQEQVLIIQVRQLKCQKLQKV